MNQSVKPLAKRTGAGLALAAAVLGAGCSAVNIDKTRENQNDSKQNATKIFEQGMEISSGKSAISVSDGYYIAEDPIILNQRDLLPDMFHADDGFSQPDPVSLQDLISVISDEYGLRIEFTDEAGQHVSRFDEAGSDTGSEDLSGEDALENSESILIEDLASGDAGATGGLPGSSAYFTIQHDGSLAELLDKVTGKVGLFWEYKNNQVTIFRTQSKQFFADVATINEQFSASFSTSAGQDNSEANSSADYSYNDGEMISPNGSDGTFINSIENMLSDSDAASVQAVPRLNLITVRDIPPKVREIGEYIEKVNVSATTQIAMRVDVITFVDEDSQNYGFDWAAVFDGSNDIGFEFNSSLSNAANSNLKVGLINPTGNFSGSDAFVNALSEAGLVTTSYTKFGQTSNGVSLPILDEDTQDYVASLKTETREFGVITQTEIETAVTGLDMNILPKMTSRNKISLNIKLAVNELEDLEERNFGDNQVQLPRKSSRSSFFSPILTPGKTYMIGGLASKRSNTSDASITGDGSFFSWLLGGRKTSNVKEEQTVVLVTPYIIES